MRTQVSVIMLQLQPVPDSDVVVKPIWKMSFTDTGPTVGPAPMFDTHMVNELLLLPDENGPSCVIVIVTSAGAVVTGVTVIAAQA